MYARICQKNKEIGKNEERSHYGGKAESKKIPVGAAKEVLTPQYPYALNQHVLWVAHPETGSWGWGMDGRGTGAPCPHQGQEVRAEEVAPVTGVVSRVKEASDLHRLQQWVLLCTRGWGTPLALPPLRWVSD